MEPGQYVEYTPEQKERLAKALKERLQPNEISKRRGNGNLQFSYLQHWKVVENCNAIFGFSGWSSFVECVQQDYIERHSSGLWECAAHAVVRVQLPNGACHADVGTGTGKNKNKAEAMSKAKKQAISDGRKRALRIFGSKLGGDIYDHEYLEQLATEERESKRKRVVSNAQVASSSTRGVVASFNMPSVRQLPDSAAGSHNLAMKPYGQSSAGQADPVVASNAVETKTGDTRNVAVTRNASPHQLRHQASESNSKNTGGINLHGQQKSVAQSHGSRGTMSKSATSNQGSNSATVHTPSHRQLGKATHTTPHARQSIIAGKQLSPSTPTDHQKNGNNRKQTDSQVLRQVSSSPVESGTSSNTGKAPVHQQHMKLATTPEVIPGQLRNEQSISTRQMLNATMPQANHSTSVSNNPANIQGNRLNPTTVHHPSNQMAGNAVPSSSFQLSSVSHEKTTDIKQRCAQGSHPDLVAGASMNDGKENCSPPSPLRPNSAAPQLAKPVTSRKDSASTLQSLSGRSDGMNKTSEVPLTASQDDDLWLQQVAEQY